MYETEQLSHTPIYDGAALSAMDSLVTYLHWFSSHPSISKEALSDILRMEHYEVLPLSDILRMEHYEVLPQGNRLPSSYHDAMKLVEPFLIQPIVFHVCSNDCVLFSRLSSMCALTIAYCSEESILVWIHVRFVVHRDLSRKESQQGDLPTFYWSAAGPTFWNSKPGKNSTGTYYATW